MNGELNKSPLAADAAHFRAWPYVTDEVAEYFNTLYRTIDPNLPCFNETGPYTSLGFSSDSHRLREEDHLALYNRVWLVVDEGARKIRLADHPHFFSHATDAPVYIRGTQTVFRPALAPGKHHFRLILGAHEQLGDGDDQVLYEAVREVPDPNEFVPCRRDAVIGGPERGQVTLLLSNVPSGTANFNVWLGSTMGGTPELPDSPCEPKEPHDRRCEPFPAELQFWKQPPQRVPLLWRGIDTIRSTDPTIFLEMTAFRVPIQRSFGTARLVISGLHSSTDFVGGGDHTPNGQAVVTVP